METDFDGKGKNMKRIYLDYAATTPVKKQVLDAMLPYYQYEASFITDKDLNTLIETFKNQFLEIIKATSGFVEFTASGSEGNNLILKTMSDAFKDKGKHIITSQIEHPSVYKVMEKLEKDGYEVSYIPCDRFGVIDVDVLKKTLRPDTILVSVMLINNEVGTRQPIEAISKLCQDEGVFFHVDAIQGLGNTEIQASILGPDALTFSAHKVYAPKGCGAIYIKDDRYKPLFEGPRCYFESNVPYIAGFLKGAQEAIAQLDSNRMYKFTLRKRLIEGVLNLDLGILVNGPNQSEHHHPGIVNLYVPQMDGDSLVINYDRYGIALSSGSACSSGALMASHVLKAMGLSESEASRCIRMSIGDFTTEEDIDVIVNTTEQILKGYKHVR